jgi:hypothetical protein
MSKKFHLCVWADGFSKMIFKNYYFCNLTETLVSLSAFGGFFLFFLLLNIGKFHQIYHSQLRLSQNVFSDFRK